MSTSKNFDFLRSYRPAQETSLDATNGLCGLAAGVAPSPSAFEAGVTYAFSLDLDANPNVQKTSHFPVKMRSSHMPANAFVCQQRGE